MKDRVIVSFSLPLSLKRKIENIVAKKNFEEDKRTSISNYCYNSVLLKQKIDEMSNFRDLKDIFSEIFVNNTNLSLDKKLEILKDFEDLIKKYICDIEEYFAFRNLFKKDIEDFDLVEKVEKKGQMASWVVLKMQKEKKEKKDEDN